MELRHYREEDAVYISRWIKDERAMRLFGADRYEAFPLTAAAINANYQACMKAGGFYPLTAVEQDDIVGHMIMRWTQPGVLRFGFIIVDDAKRGQGLGKKMLQEAIIYARDVMKARSLTLGVFADNIPAVAAYHSVGFIEDQTAAEDYFPIFGENWRCIEMVRNVDA